MRCKNCGWDNPVGRSRCEKCNVPLSGSMIDSDVSFSQHSSVEETGFTPNKTVYEEEVFKEEVSGGGAGRKCEKCGYPLRPGQGRCPECEAETVIGEEEKKAYCPQCGQALKGATNFCPNCGTSLNGPQEKKEFGRKTVLPAFSLFLNFNTGRKRAYRASDIGFFGGGNYFEPGQYGARQQYHYFPGTGCIDL